MVTSLSLTQINCINNNMLTAKKKKKFKESLPIPLSNMSVLFFKIALKLHMVYNIWENGPCLYLILIHMLHY